MVCSRFQSGNIGLNDGQLRLRTPIDNNHYIAYHGGGGFDGAKLYGNRRYPCKQVTWKSYFVTAEWV